MIDEKDLENKGLGDKPNKTKKTVRVRVKPNRAVEGIGKAGTEASIDEQEAKRLVKIGYVELVVEAK